MNSVVRHARVVLGALLAGAILFGLGFKALEFVWTHFVVSNPDQIGLGDGVVVIGGGFLVGSTVGLAGLIIVLYRFWPRRASK